MSCIHAEAAYGNLVLTPFSAAGNYCKGDNRPFLSNRCVWTCGHMVMDGDGGTHAMTKTETNPVAGSIVGSIPGTPNRQEEQYT